MREAVRVEKNEKLLHYCTGGGVGGNYYTFHFVRGGGEYTKCKDD